MRKIFYALVCIWGGSDYAMGPQEIRATALAELEVELLAQGMLVKKEDRLFDDRIQNPIKDDGYNPEIKEEHREELDLLIENFLLQADGNPSMQFEGCVVYDEDEGFGLVEGDELATSVLHLCADYKPSMLPQLVRLPGVSVNMYSHEGPVIARVIGCNRFENQSARQALHAVLDAGAVWRYGEPDPIMGVGAQTILHDALKSKSMWAIQELCRRPQATECINSIGDIVDPTPIHTAPQHLLELFLTIPGIDVHCGEGSLVGTALHSRAKRLEPEIIRLLVARGWAVNARSLSGFTPLHEALWGYRKEDAATRGASHERRRETLQALLAAGADVALRDKKDRTPASLLENSQDAFAIEYKALLQPRGAADAGQA